MNTVKSFLNYELETRGFNKKERKELKKGRRGVENSDPSTPLHNITNLSGGQSCRRSILLFFSSKIYIQKPKLHSTFARASLLFDNFAKLNFIFGHKKWSEFFLHSKSAAEIREKEGIMRFRVIHGGKGASNSEHFELAKNSKSKSYIPRKEYALNFIHKNKVTKENFTHKVSKNNLSKTERESIRYYLKKSKDNCNFNKDEIQTKSTGLNKAFILVPVLAVELAVIYLSAQFYRSIGITIILAFTLAISAECFYMISSSHNNFKQNMLRNMILMYSIFTMSYGTISQDKRVNSERRELKSKLIQFNTSNNLLLKEIANLNVERASMLEMLEMYKERSLLTRGQKIIGPKLSTLNSKKEKLISKFDTNRAAHTLLQNELSSKSYISLGILKRLELGTYFLIFGLILLQVCSSIYLRTSITALKKILRLFFINRRGLLFS